MQALELARYHLVLARCVGHQYHDAALGPHAHERVAGVRMGGNAIVNDAPDIRKHHIILARKRREVREQWQGGAQGRTELFSWRPAERPGSRSHPTFRSRPCPPALPPVPVWVERTGSLVRNERRNREDRRLSSQFRSVRR